MSEVRSLTDAAQPGHTTGYRAGDSSADTAVKNNIVAVTDAGAGSSVSRTGSSSALPSTRSIRKWARTNRPVVARRLPMVHRLTAGCRSNIDAFG